MEWTSFHPTISINTYWTAITQETKANQEHLSVHTREPLNISALCMSKSKYDCHFHFDLLTKFCEKRVLVRFFQIHRIQWTWHKLKMITTRHNTTRTTCTVRAVPNVKRKTSRSQSENLMIRTLRLHYWDTSLGGTEPHILEGQHAPFHHVTTSRLEPGPIVVQESEHHRATNLLAPLCNSVQAPRSHPSLGIRIRPGPTSARRDTPYPLATRHDCC